MPSFGAISRRDLIYYLKQLGFEGPYSGTRHQFMVRDEVRLIIPNPHEGDISKSLLAKILKQAQINRDEWEVL
ncbi:type II toxin-antitoxin system HicA family toxin [Anabaena sp. UHCC 0204]|jgi:predicted RNA binding protein YcfA (HicA-like mRNA interferase family)|uniref:type II toxin-antitoxin system HicA family toxin n=1 Tax=Anabaena sp. UHCC 0204 TaxID=2590009 RepID=UPI0014467B69|nr:type II toxin-antitoxin system HicA family toxin [Anabaena sp. UHCC 0204]MTJ09035.1 type II toxin-antitoxin system HicA family toxin [Anabaena sp. UHCC 0204]